MNSGLCQALGWQTHIGFLYISIPNNVGILSAKKNKETFVHPNLYLLHRLRIPEHREINYLAHTLEKA